jgi:hypothetical protein
MYVREGWEWNWEWVNGRGVTHAGLCLHHGYGSSRAFEMLWYVYLADDVVSHQKTAVCMVTAWRNLYLTRFSWFFNYQVIWQMQSLKITWDLNSMLKSGKCTRTFCKLAEWQTKPCGLTSEETMVWATFTSSPYQTTYIYFLKILIILIPLHICFDVN